jgi:hypothetical protein
MYDELSLLPFIWRSLFWPSSSRCRPKIRVRSPISSGWTPYVVQHGEWLSETRLCLGKVELSSLTIGHCSYLDKVLFHMFEFLEPAPVCYNFLHIFREGYRTVVSLFPHLDHTWHYMVTLSSYCRSHRLKIKMQNKALCLCVALQYFGSAKEMQSFFHSKSYILSQLETQGSRTRPPLSRRNISSFCGDSLCFLNTNIYRKIAMASHCSKNMRWALQAFREDSLDLVELSSIES